MPSSIFELTSDMAVVETLLYKRPTVAASDEATVLTADQAIGGVVTMTPGAGRALTTPTGAQLKTAIGNPLEVGTCFELTVVNGAASTHAITLTAAASGITLSGVAGMATVAAGTSATYLFVCTATGTPAFTVYRM